LIIHSYNVGAPIPTFSDLDEARKKLKNRRKLPTNIKVLERIVNKSLVYILEERNLVPSQQYGFRKNRSTTEVLTILENNIAEAIKKRQSTAMVSLDIS
jgi:hypothetical protein